jgi:DNA-binding PadR family transcriptional regulator
MKALSCPEREIILRILADTDAIWLPFRARATDDGKVAAAIAERRSLFRRVGIQLAIGGGDAVRQSGHRDLRSLVSKGLIRILGRGKRRGVTLTNAGDNYVRSIAPSLRIDEAWPALRLVRCVELLFALPIRAYMLEFDILQIDQRVPLNGNASRLLDFEFTCLPLLASGLLESSSDTQMRLGYRTTHAGRAALAKRKPARPRNVPPYSSAVGREFTQLWKAALAARDTWSPSRPGLVWIPLSAGMWPRRPEGAVDG